MPDVQLVELAREGDRNAFRALAERHRGRVYATTIAILRDPMEAAAATRDTFERAFDGLSTLDEPRRFGAWISGIAASAARDRRRKAGASTAGGPIDDVVKRRIEAQKAVLDAARAHAPRVVAAFEGGDLVEAKLSEGLPVFLADLDAPTRRALALRYEKGLSYAEIAKEIGVPEDVIAAALQRAGSALRERLASVGPTAVAATPAAPAAPETGDGFDPLEAVAPAAEVAVGEAIEPLAVVEPISDEGPETLLPVAPAGEIDTGGPQMTLPPHLLAARPMPGTPGAPPVSDDGAALDVSAASVAPETPEAPEASDASDVATAPAEVSEGDPDGGSAGDGEVDQRSGSDAQKVVS